MFKRSLILFCCVFLLPVAQAQTYTEVGATFDSFELIGRVLFGETPWGSDDILNPSVSGITNSYCTRYSDFTLGNNNSSDDNFPNEEYFREIVRGNSYTLSIRGDACSSGSIPNTRGVKVFIDWNKDYDFDDVGETVWTALGVSSATPTFTTSVTIPSYAVADTLRMRVVYARIQSGWLSILWPRTSSPIFTATTAYNYGETEDYDLIVLGLIDTVDVVHESCPGANDGVITVIPESTVPSNLEYSITSIAGPWSTNPVFLSLSAGNYTVWAMDPSTGDVESENVVVNAAAACFDIDAGIDLFSCEGDPVQLNAEVVAGATYSWTPSAGMNDPTISNPEVSPTATTTYTLQVDSAGETATDSITIYVYPYPVFAVSGTQDVCDGGFPADLSASYIPFATYTWSPVTALSTPNTNQTSFSTGVSVTTTYSVSVNLVGCIFEDSVAVTVNPVPSVSLSAFPTPVCAGGTVILQATPTGTANYFQYQQDVSGIWVDLTNPAMNSINPMVISPINIDTDFRVRVAEDWPNCTASDYDYITVPVINITVPPIIHN
tara:strand:+ start:227 stop:1876 length:1650 start_codon:yes stop_codon:yes gene_type:complete